MIPAYLEILTTLESAFRKFEATVPSPNLVNRGSYPVFRYNEPTIEAAILQKCARLISGLHTTIILLEHGFAQEIGVIGRTLDEFIEDIMFLCPAVDHKNRTRLHDDYLTDFYQEEFDNPYSPINSTQKRKTIRRKKIHAAIARFPEQQINQSDFQLVLRTTSQVSSGFVHGASSQIMELYGGDPPHFHISGMLNTPRVTEFEEYAWNYFYRGLISVMRIALAFDETKLVSDLYEFRNYIEIKTGHTEWENSEVLIKTEKSKQ